MAAALRLLILQPLLLQMCQTVGLQAKMDTNKVHHRDTAAAGQHLLRRDVTADEIEEHHKEPTASNDHDHKPKRLAVPGHIALAVISDGLIEGTNGKAMIEEDSAQSPASIGGDSCDCTPGGYVFAKAYNLTRCIKEAESGANGNDKCSKTGHGQTWADNQHGQYDSNNNNLTTSTGVIDIGNLMTDLANGIKSDAVKSEFKRLLDHVADQALMPAIHANGVVWTDNDMNTFEACQDQQPCVHSDGSTMTEEQVTVDGCAVSQGDVMSETCTSSLLQVRDDKGNLTQFGVLLEAAATHRRVVDNIWPLTSSTQHVIKYCFSSTISTDAKEAIGFAKLHIEDQVGCLKFEEVSTVAGTNNFADADQENCAVTGEGSILIQSSKAGCWSLVGMHSNTGSFAGMSQPMNIGVGCEEMGICAHEFGHAIGMLHEMSRDDRNTYLSVAMEHVPESFQINFQTNSDADQGTTFDFLSLMMYGAYAFSSSGELTIEPVHKELVNFMGQRMGFSELDIELIGRLYSCADRTSPQTQNKRLSEAYVTGDIDTGFVGYCEDKEGSETGFTNPTTQQPMTCTELREHCNHATLGSTVRTACPVSCYVCQAGDGYVGGSEPVTETKNETKTETETKTTKSTINCTANPDECNGACAWKLGVVPVSTLLLWLLGQD